MDGQKGVTIVVVAMVLTVLAAYCLNTTSEISDVVTYSHDSDLTPIVESSPVTQYEPYNPAANVTGWLNSDGTNPVPTTTAGSIYRLTPSYHGYTSSSKSVSASDLVYLTGETQRTPYAGAKLSNGAIWNMELPVSGGAPSVFNGGPASVTVDTQALHNPIYKLESMSGAASYWVTSSQIMAAAGDLKDGDVIVLGTGLKASSDAFKLVCTQANQVITWAWESGAGVTACNALQYVAATGKFTAGTWGGSSFTGIMPNCSDFVYSLDSVHAVNFTIQRPQVTPALYADPTKLVTIYGFDEFTRWSNGMLNGTVTILASWDVVIFSPEINNASLDAGGPYVHITAGTDVYPYILYTLDVANSNYYWQGVTSLTDAQHYTVMNYKYPLSVPDVALKGVTYLNLYGDHDEIVGRDGGRAYIVGTVVSVDPDGLLWGNAALDLSRYFGSDVLNSARVTFNGFVKAPSSIEINGQAFNVTGGAVTIDGQTLALNGLALDYADGHVTARSGAAVADLGAVTDYAIKTVGVSYFQSDLYSINHTVTSSQVLDIDGLWHASTNEALLVFLGICGAGLMIAHYRRDSFGMADWAVIIISAIVALSIVVV